MQVGGVAPEQGVQGEGEGRWCEDDELAAWRLQLERRRQLAGEQRRTAALLQAYRARQEAEQRAQEPLLSAWAAAEGRWQEQQQRQRLEEQGEQGPLGAGEAGRPEDEPGPSQLEAWRQLELRWQELEQRLQLPAEPAQASWGSAEGPGRGEAPRSSSGAVGAVGAGGVTRGAAQGQPLSPGPSLRTVDIPWPPSTQGMLAALSALESQRVPARPSTPATPCCVRRAYLGAVRRWHPDRATALLAALPPGPERAVARQRLLGVCQELTRQYREAQAQAQARQSG
ncbi:hypothetical protein HYH03_002743 [Edaphochlamys debaryana]|uniref:Uncharacterized protein n=1 Tax=Edaphochlamys debaryana TaxID=47281 RepID=A0A835YCP6_9CHLO|nr:hypothetical protein HYH03_002743 [Edaphochlamys debaryana]|eukprot:KAG2499162.1 hypothetical protein HYH03_002743 [Edaphochlamys debaryana]